MKKHLIKLKDYGEFRVSELSPVRLTQTIRLRASKNKGPSIEDVEKKFQVRKCGFCGSTCRNYIFNFSSDYTEVVGIQYNNELFYCHQRGCPGKKLNPNSVAFVAGSRGLSETEALHFIKARNRSPFYIENHATVEDYRKFQGVLSRLPTERVQDIVAKQNYARSIEAYIEKWGEKEGTQRWKLVQASKAITPEKMIDKYGPTEGLERYERWKQTCKCTLENFIRRHGDEEGNERYKRWLGKVTRSGGGYGVRTAVDGMKFYSLFELRFYRALQAVDFSYPFEHDICYPDVFWRSDFYFPLIDVHLEIAGMIGNEAYDRRLKEKIARFNPLVVQEPEECDKMAQYIKDLHAAF